MSKYRIHLLNILLFLLTFSHPSGILAQDPLIQAGVPMDLSCRLAPIYPGLIDRLGLRNFLCSYSLWHISLRILIVTVLLSTILYFVLHISLKKLSPLLFFMGISLLGVLNILRWSEDSGLSFFGISERLDRPPGYREISRKQAKQCAIEYITNNPSRYKDADISTLYISESASRCSFQGNGYCYYISVDSKQVDPSTKNKLMYDFEIDSATCMPYRRITL